MSRTDETLGFVWRSLDGSLIGRPMLIGRDGTGLRSLPLPPKIAGGRVDPLPVLYLR